MDIRYDWEIGRNGIRLVLKWSNYKMESTFLPSVAKDNKWNKKQTILQLARKALSSKSNHLGSAMNEKNMDSLLNVFNPVLVKYESSKFDKDYNVLGVILFKKDREVKTLNGIKVKRIHYAIGETHEFHVWTKGDKKPFIYVGRLKELKFKYKNYIFESVHEVHIDYIDGGQADHVAFQIDVIK